MTTHTPGPWAASQNSVYWQINGPDGAIVGDVCGTSVWATAEEEAANARLIAAAPELLEACDMARIVLAGIPCKTKQQRQLLQDTFDALTKASQKATGESK